MKNIIIKTIPDSHQRYNTVGDYYKDESGNQVFVVSDMNNWKYEFLVVLHEMIESALCTDRGITDEMIDAFDFAFEENRIQAGEIQEPGNSPEAPYYKEHQFSSEIEKLVSKELGVNWEHYTTVVEKLDRNQEVI